MFGIAKSHDRRMRKHKAREPRHAGCHEQAHGKGFHRTERHDPDPVKASATRYVMNDAT